ncbi:hypothetical protein HMPREF2846_02745 [Staphylococcus sp. HMSC056G08]|nr:hypothetical protein HMPREF2846_02745 [Staphylococcus sp. HMSC056G08]
MLVERQEVYREIDNFLIKQNKKKRYNPESPEAYFYNHPKVKQMLSNGFRLKHAQSLNEPDIKQKKQQIISQRKKAIKKQDEKIKAAKINAQNVNPNYLDKLMNAYHKKKLNAEEKLIILDELTRFDTKKITTFFRKINASERNMTLRHFAFFHLQSYGHYVTLRKGFKGKKKSYMIEEADLSDKTPEDLYNLIATQKTIMCQEYDYFISHSSKDKELVRKTIQKLNGEGKFCYCDWTLDDTFLKRDLVSDYTKEVLKLRMRQSKKMIIIKTKNSSLSCWVNFEKEYFESLGKEIIIIEK